MAQLFSLGFEMKKSIIIFTLLPVILSGCGTINARMPLDSTSRTRFYPATCFDGQMIGAPFIPDNYDTSGFPKLAGCLLMGVIDLPISLVTDTICIPVDIWAYKQPNQ